MSCRLSNKLFGTSILKRIMFLSVMSFSFAYVQMMFMLKLMSSASLQANANYGDFVDPHLLVDPSGLLSRIRYRYYIYNSTDLHQLLNPPKAMVGYHGAVWSIYEALANHPLRTLDPNEAALFIPPLFVNSVVDAGVGKNNIHRKDLMTAFDIVTASQIYQKTLGKRHVLMAIDGWYFSWISPGNGIDGDLKYYEPDWIKQYTPKWFDNSTCNWDNYQGKGGERPCIVYGNIFQNIILARERDAWEVQRIYASKEGSSNYYQEWTKDKAKLQDDVPVPLQGFSFGLMGGPAEVELIPATYTKYNSSTHVYFYHTREDKFSAGSTKFRHAPVLNTPAKGTVEANTYNLSSVGFDIHNPTEWSKKFGNSKFCLVIRGDTPSSKALLRAIRVGCIPVIISDIYNRYAPSYKTTLNMSDYAIFVKETDFVVNPWGELHRIYTSLTEVDIRQKLAAVSFAQRVIFPDHPDSLFVQAFVREAWESISVSDRVVGCGTDCIFEN